MISLRSTYLSCALLALFAVPAFCSPVFYVDRPTWVSAVASPTTITFENAFGSYSTASGFTTGLSLPDNPTFVGMYQLANNGASGYSLQILDPTLSPYYNFGSGASLWWSALNSSITSSVLHVTFPSPVTAVAVDLMTYSGSGVPYSAKINNDASMVYTTSATQPNPNRTFFGFTSDIPISSIDFYLPTSAIGVTPLIDNFSYGTSLAAAPAGPSDTPELCTFLLIASGLIGMALIGRGSRRLAIEAS